MSVRSWGLVSELKRQSEVCGNEWYPLPSYQQKPWNRTGKSPEKAGPKHSKAVSDTSWDFFLSHSLGLQESIGDLDCWWQQTSLNIELVSEQHGYHTPGTNGGCLNLDNGKIIICLTSHPEIVESVNILIFHSRRSTNKPYNWNV